MTTTDETKDVAATVDMVNATIDGKQVCVPKGTLVIRAAEKIGTAIPRFCDHPLLEPVGACRQCLVEVAMPGRDGEVRPMPKPQPACTMEISEGMQVKTQITSDVADKAQKGVMEFLLINHPLDCPVCDKGGECPLQNQAMSNGRATSRFVDVKRTFPKPIKISTEVLLDRERCVLCQRCTRFSKQIAGDPFIDLQMRGAKQQIGIFDPSVLGLQSEGHAAESESGVPFSSYFSGNTIQICPVGALTSATYRFRSRPFDLVSSPSVCEHCASGCSLRVDHRRGTVLRRLAGEDPHVNEEWNCDKGRFAFAYPTLDDRIERPLVRDEETGELREASWPEAFERAAEGLRAARDGDGASLGVTGAMSAGVGVLLGGRHTREDAYAYGKFARTVLATNDIDFRNRVHSDEEDAFLGAVVAGRPVTDSVTYADLEAASAVLLVGFEPEDESPIVFLRLRKAARRGMKVVTVSPFTSRGSEKLRASVIHAAPGTEPEIVDALRTRHVEVQDEAEALHGDRVVILVGERAAGVPGLLTAVHDLCDATSARVAWIPRRAGERGALDAGCLPKLLPGGRDLNDPSARADVASVWGTPELPQTPGRNAAQIATAAGAGELAGLIIAGVDYRDATDVQLLLGALGNTPFVVAMDLRHSPITAAADVVFPVAPVAEKSGSFVNWEGRVRSFDQALSSSAFSDTKVLVGIADYMDEAATFGLTSVDHAAHELDELSEWDGGRIDGPGAAVAAPNPPAPGHAVVASWHQLLDGGRMQDGEAYLAGTARKAIARMSGKTAGIHGLTHGHDAVFTGEHGSLTLPVVVTSMPDDVVWLPAATRTVVLRELGLGAGDVVTCAPASASSTQGVMA